VICPVDGWNSSEMLDSLSAVVEQTPEFLLVRVPLLLREA